MDLQGFTPWPIVKWVLIVLVAAFIGQFGRALATHLIERARQKRGRELAARGPEGPPSEGPATAVSPQTVRTTAPDPPADGKLEKKRLKAEIKRQKKFESPE